MGGLIRDHKGQWVTGFHRDMKATSSAMVELWALRDGLNLTLMKNIKQLAVEPDALVVSGTKELGSSPA